MVLLVLCAWDTRRLAHVIVDLLISNFLCEVSSWLLIILHKFIVLLLVDFAQQFLGDALDLLGLRILFTEQVGNQLLDLSNLLLFFRAFVYCMLDFDFGECNKTRIIDELLGLAGFNINGVKLN